MIEKVISTINQHQMLLPSSTVIAGVSGGVDSMVMLHILNRLKGTYGITIRVVHINHLLRGEEAKRDELFVRDTCEQMGISFIAYHCDIGAFAKEKKISVEEAGRMKRYEFLQAERKKQGGERIAVAHNLNDHCETVLMRLLRGSGNLGLQGISPVREALIRPLLYCTREEIEHYAKEYQVPFVQDSSNFELAYTRNKIRHDLMPYIIGQLNPNFLNTITRTADIIKRNEDYIAIEAEKVYHEIITEKENRIEIPIDLLWTYHEAIIYWILRNALLNCLGSLKDIEYKHITLLYDFCHKQTGKSFSLPGCIQAEISYGKLILKKEQASAKISISLAEGAFEFIPPLKKYISCSFEGAILNKLNFVNTCTMVFGYDTIITNLVLRNRLPGDRIYFKSIGGSKKIKDFFIDQKVPREKRDGILLLALENEILWIVDPDCGLNEKNIVSDKFNKEMNTQKIYIQLWEDMQ